MNITGTVALFAWTPLVLILSVVFPARWIVPGSLVFGYLLLPVGSIRFSGLPDVDKLMLVGVAATIAMVLTDSMRLARIRFGFYDIWIVLLCIWPMGSAIANGDGAYDGASAVLKQVTMFGLPYLIGRVYCSDANGMRVLIKAIIYGGLLYLPLCLWEMRMSPQLHTQLYGFRPGGGASSSGLFGLLPHARAVVFLDMAINTFAFMATASIAMIVLWRAGTMRSFFNVPMSWLAGLMSFVTVIGRVGSANVILLIGGGGGYAAKSWFRQVVLLVILAAPPSYMMFRMTGNWSGELLVTLVEPFSDAKAYTLRARLKNEDRMLPNIRQNPTFGWGSSSGFMTDDVDAVDGYWLILSGKYGLPPLAFWTIVCLLPGYYVFRRIPRPLWYHPAVAPAFAGAIILSMYLVHNIFNAMIFPAVMAISGGLMCMAASWPRTAAAVSQTRAAAPPTRRPVAA